MRHTIVNSCTYCIGHSNFKAKETKMPDQNQRLEPPTELIRKFDSGATRDTKQGKLNYVKALSAAVLKRYVEYLDKHRVQPDGSLRDWDNWKKGIPQEEYAESLDRHNQAMKLLDEHQDVYDNHGLVTMEDTLCAIMFNAMGRLFEILTRGEK